jgi:superfamily II DNA/RNA helicase
MLTRFKNNEFTFMICSDVAARGLDIPALSHVFNFDVPSHAEDYVHRIGRTGRAGIEGHAYTIAVPEDRKYIEAITRLIGRKIPPIIETETVKTNNKETGVKHTKPFEKNAKKSAVQANNDAQSIGSNKGVRKRGHNRKKETKVKKADVRKKEHFQAETPPLTEQSQENGFVKFGDTDHVPAFMQRPKSK